MTKLDAFIKKYQGKIVADPRGLYRGECVSLVKQWLSFNAWPQKNGNAINWQFNGNNGYSYIQNRLLTIPRPGDMSIFQIIGSPYGHIGIVVSATLKSMVVFNQNWPSGKDTDPAKLTTFDYRRPRCIGFLRKV